jgi:hypothetical protein
MLHIQNRIDLGKGRRKYKEYYAVMLHKSRNRESRIILLNPDLTSMDARLLELYSFKMTDFQAEKVFANLTGSLGL